MKLKLSASHNLPQSEWQYHEHQTRIQIRLTDPLENKREDANMLWNTEQNDRLQQYIPSIRSIEAKDSKQIKQEKKVICLML